MTYRPQLAINRSAASLTNKSSSTTTTATFGVAVNVCAASRAGFSETTGDTGFYDIVNGINTGWYDVGASSTAYSVVATGDYLGTGTSDIVGKFPC
jgi:hypothetical protein